MGFITLNSTTMASIAPKTTLLGFDNAAHLLRRSCFSVNKSLINQYALLSPQQAVSMLFNFTYTENVPLNHNNQTYIPTVTNPVVQSTLISSFYDHTQHWLYKASTTNTIEYKLALWLHLCFICSDESFFYICHDTKELFRYHTKDNLKNLAIRITQNTQMLSFLDNRFNTVSNSNQNYAREFLELFTILKGPQTATGSYTTYSEMDVQQAAKVFTGFNLINNNFLIQERLGYFDPVTNIPKGVLIPSAHDQTNKSFSALLGGQTIVGQSTQLGMQQELSSFIDMIFNQPATAKSYASRLYRYFVGRNITTTIEQDIIEPLAQTLLNNNYNIELAVKQLLTSQHFYDEDDAINGDTTIGAITKSPLDLILNIITLFQIDLPNYSSNAQSITNFFNINIYQFCEKCGFRIFSPTSVNGYSAYTDSPNYDKNWVNTTSLYIRYNETIDRFISGITYNNHLYKLVTTTFVQNSGHFSNPANAETLVQEFYSLLFVSAPTGTRHDYFKNTLLGGLSIINWQNEWQSYLDNNPNNGVKIRLDALVKALIKSPEFQVM